MKTPLLVTAATVLLAIAPALPAQQASPSVTDNAQSTDAAADTARFEKEMAQVRANTKKMQEEMDKIHQAKDPAERQRLMQAHMATMQSTMGMMRGMMGPGMMDCCAPGAGAGARMMGGPGMGMGPGGMMGGPGRFTPEQMQQRHQMMEQMMGMQQMMMQNMLDYQQMMQANPAR